MTDMQIRMATEEDIGSIFGLFADMSLDHLQGYDTIIDREKIKTSLVSMVRAQSVYLAQTEEGKIVGGMAGTIYPSLLSNDVVMCSMFFYIDKDKRNFTAGFIKQLEQILSKTGVTRLVIGNPDGNNGPEMDRFYSMLGFKKLETHYIKAV